MAVTNSRRLNAKLRALNPGLSICGGRGYQYFRFSSDAAYDTRSVYVNRMADLTEDEWLVEARAFLADLGVAC